MLEDAKFDRVLSSPYVRCMETVVPIAADRGRSVEPVEALAEGARLDETLALVRKHTASGALMCTHGDVMPMLLDHYASIGVDLPKRPAVAEGLRLDARHRRAPARSCARSTSTHRWPDAQRASVDSPSRNARLQHREEAPCPRSARKPPISR